FYSPPRTAPRRQPPTPTSHHTPHVKVGDRRASCAVTVTTLGFATSQIRLLSRYKAHKKPSSTTQDSSIETQISKYFDVIHVTDTDTDNALSFWAKNHDRDPQLHNLAMKVLSVPASSAPVDRVFSSGSIIMRPRRACLGHKMLQSLIFLKCNQMLL
ncbi:uncharacterized protein LOC115775858, partial [Tachysurus ichikawai]